jgi:glycosyltransferase involved in cell wall biosynthesis
MSKGVVLLDQSSGYLQIDMLHALKEKYPKTAILAGSIVERNRKLPESTFWQKVIPYDKSTTFRRLMSWTVSSIQMWYHVITKFSGYKLLIITNPPFAALLPLILPNRYSILVYDIYPDILYSTGTVSKRSWIVSLWSKLNKRVYSKADEIYTISEGMKHEVAKYTDNRKIEVVPIWTNAGFFKPVQKKDNCFLKDLGFQNKFIVQYSGNLGNTHDIDVLVDVAYELRNYEDIQFIIIGDGGKKKLIESKIKDYGVTNCLLLPWQPADMLPYTLTAPDIGVVTLGRESSNMSVPSKTFNLMSAGQPIMAIASEQSELNRLIKYYQAGACFSGENREGIKNFILSLRDNPKKRKEYSENALAASKDFTVENAELFS